MYVNPSSVFVWHMGSSLSLHISSDIWYLDLEDCLTIHLSGMNSFHSLPPLCQFLAMNFSQTD